MSASNEWTDHHLTPTGGVAGTSRLDYGPERHVPDPFGSVAVFRYQEHLSSTFSKMDRSVTLMRRIGGEAEVNHLARPHADPAPVGKLVRAVPPRMLECPSP